VNAPHRAGYGAAEVLVWIPRRGLVPATPGDDPLLAADSWLVESGAARALSRHERRFEIACRQTGCEAASDLRAFWTDAIRVLPRHGRWFPRVELTAAARPQLRLRIRPAPARASTVRVWAATGPDQRRQPRRKGPDLPWLNSVRTRAVGSGADEALLTTPGGLLLEATQSSVLWWEDDILCFPSRTLRLLPGVTASLIHQHACRSGLGVKPHRRHLAELSGREAWLVNALHGIRPVREWTGTGVRAGEPDRIRSWQPWWERLLEPLP